MVKIRPDTYGTIPLPIRARLASIHLDKQSAFDSGDFEKGLELAEEYNRVYNEWYSRERQVR